MPSAGYMNHPLWDFVAQLDGQGSGNSADHDTAQPPNPWQHPWTQQGWGQGTPFGGPFAHRGRHQGPPGPPPPPAHDGDHHQHPASEQERGAGAGPSEPRGPPPPFSEHGPPPAGPGAHRGRCGARGRGGWGGRGRGRGGPHHAAPGPPPMMAGFEALAQMFQDQLFPSNSHSTNDTSNSTNRNKAAEDSSTGDFTPETDLFSTPHAYILHLSLPGAQKSDISVNWEESTSSLHISGVVHRLGDEELLRSLVGEGERKVGVFEKRIKLGGKEEKVEVDGEGISARMEDGVLRVEVPKVLEEEGFVEVRRVEVE